MSCFCVDLKGEKLRGADPGLTAPRNLRCFSDPGLTAPSVFPVDELRTESAPSSAPSVFPVDELRTELRTERFPRG